ncbi:gamma-glutamylcyclotransferase family protein [Paenibacillus sp. LPE1-1-1.1]|uniref:gamma-glutamylcyclotransferase family protein n=1 Tax=Paenibacillus sp. LPE1-1-1.1 TaxID=3135230 RepID=UPI003412E796
MNEWIRKEMRAIPLINVFIYGSLLPGQSNHEVVSAYAASSKPGRISGRLVDCGAYPAAVRDEIAFGRNSIIRGLWITVDREGLAAMDRLEEFYGAEELNDYERIWVRDAADRKVSGWVYVWESDRGSPSVEEDYWPDFYAHKIGTANK